jgi:hypothetical protein
VSFSRRGSSPFRFFSSTVSALIFLIHAIAIAIVATGCTSPTHDITPARGGTIVIEEFASGTTNSAAPEKPADVSMVNGSTQNTRDRERAAARRDAAARFAPQPAKRITVKMPDNADGKTTLNAKPDGSISVGLPPARDNKTLTLPAPDYTQETLCIAGIIVAVIGAVLIGSSWGVTIGWWLLALGAAAAIVSVTVAENSTLYTIAILGGGAVFTYARLTGYKRGIIEYKEPDTPLDIALGTTTGHTATPTTPPTATP